MSYTCFEPEGSSSGRRLYVQLWYGMFYMYRYEQSVAQWDASGKNQGFFLFNKNVTFAHIILSPVCQRTN